MEDAAIIHPPFCLEGYRHDGLHIGDIVVGICYDSAGRAGWPINKGDVSIVHTGVGTA